MQHLTVYHLIVIGVLLVVGKLIEALRKNPAKSRRGFLCIIKYANQRRSGINLQP